VKWTPKDMHDTGYGPTVKIKRDEDGDPRLDINDQVFSRGALLELAAKLLKLAARM
jgi:hypothetical protein